MSNQDYFPEGVPTEEKQKLHPHLDIVAEEKPKVEEPQKEEPISVVEKEVVDLGEIDIKELTEYKKSFEATKPNKRGRKR